MKNFRNILMLFGVAAFLYACGGGTEVAWKNGYAMDASGQNSIGSIQWVGDSKNNTWNPIDNTSSSTTGALKGQEQSDSKAVDKTTSNVSGYWFTGTWAEANQSGVSLSEGQTNVKEITLQ